MGTQHSTSKLDAKNCVSKFRYVLEMIKNIGSQRVYDYCFSVKETKKEKGWTPLGYSTLCIRRNILPTANLELLLIYSHKNSVFEGYLQITKELL